MRAESQFSRTVGVFGLSEAAVTERLSDLLADSNPAVTLQARSGGEITLTVSATADDDARAGALCEPVINEICERLGAFVYGLDVRDLQTAVVHLLTEKHLEIATAESCTAGLLSGKLTQVSGASAVFECGVAAYSKEIKHDVLGVSEEIMDAQGTVCADTAAGMAIGARRVGGSDIGIGITGEAGPHPSEDKPVGTVFIALADNRRVWVKELHAASGDRETIREIATCQALDLARRYLEALPAVMAGGQLLDEATLPPPIIPQAAPTKTRRVLSSLFPWKGDPARAIVFKSLLWAGIVAILVAVFLLLNAYIWAPARNREQYVSLEQLYTQAPSGYSSDDFPDGMLARFYALYTQNPDVKGWVKVDGTGINYPVVQNSSLDYSTLNFRRESSEYGVPYFDRNVNLSSPLSVNRSFVIHGNNTNDGQMFSDLLSFTDARFLMAHPTIEMNTIYATGTFEVFAVLYVDDEHPDGFDYRTVTFGGADDFMPFIEQLRARSLFTTSIEPIEDDSLLLLTTDASAMVGVPGIRLVVAARLLPLGETKGEDLTLSYNANVVLPESMLTSSTSQTVPGTTRNGYQSSDTLPAIDPPSDNRSDENETTPTFPIADGTTPSNGSATTTTSSSSETTSTDVTTQPDTSTGQPIESAFYRTITVKIGDSMASAIRTREELQFAVASAVKSELSGKTTGGDSTEAYKAQAVACYTYMLYACRNGDTFSVPLSINLSNADDRRFYEATGEVLGVKLADTAAKTVTDTPLCALYFSSCNGFTANSKSVYAAPIPYLRSVASPYDTDESIQKYSGGTDTLFTTFTITQEELLTKLGAYVRTLTGGTVTEVRLEEGGETPLFVKSRDAGGYVSRTNAYYVSNGQTIYLRGIDIRKALGSNALRSHSFTLSADGDILTFTVAGHGLGLGMSQYGALAYANEANYDWRQILTHYYSLSDTGRYRIVEPVWEARE